MLTWTDVTSKTNKHIVPKMIDSVYKNSPLFTRLRTKNAEQFAGGTSIRHPIAYARLKGGAFTRGQSFDTSYVQTDTALEVLVKAYYVNITLFGLDAVLNRGPEAVMSTVETKMVNAAGRMAELLGTDIFLDGQGTDSSAIQLDGLEAAIDDGNAFATYGGITRADIATGANVGINSYVKTMAGPVALADFQTAYGATWFGHEHVDLIIITQAIWDIMWNKLQPQQRFLEESTDVAKAGFQALRYNGASMTVDQYAPAAKAWFLNSKYIQFWITTLSKYQFGFTGWKEAQGNDDVSGQYLFAGNILNVAPRLMGVIKNLTS
jgi:hypothetical protein